MSKKLMIVGAACVLLLIGGIGTGFFLILDRLSGLSGTTETKGETGKEPTSEADAPGVLFPLETFIVNLVDSGGTRYLRVTLELEVGGENAVQEIKARLPIFRHAVLMILPTKRYDDISTATGKNSLRDEIMTGINALMKKGSVRNIFFTEFVVQ
jgi:flagellar protein FliL